MNGLDDSGVEETRELLIELKEQRKLTLLASHNKDIETLCDVVFTMNRGKLM